MHASWQRPTLHSVLRHVLLALSIALVTLSFLPGLPAGAAGRIAAPAQHRPAHLSGTTPGGWAAVRAQLYPGSDGLALLPSWTATGGDGHSAFGYAVASAGDVDGDGYADTVVGAPTYLTATGQVYLFRGSAAGLAATPAVTLTGETVGDHFGVAVAGAGDVDGDGYADLLVGAPDYSGLIGKVYLFRGSAAGLLPVPAWTASGENVEDYFGSSVAAAGDVDGDGYADVLVATTSFASGRGKAYLYRGSAAGLAATAAWTATGENDGDRFGRAAAAGDVNGDGYADVLAGATLHDSGRGRVYLYPGSATGLATTPAWMADGEDTGDGWGSAVAAAGDVNGDGYADVLVGAPYRATNQGRAYLYAGSATGLAATPAWTADGESGGGTFGWVATAGDVDGDGYADVLVAAPNGGWQTGKVYLFEGSAAGLVAVPSWTATGETRFDVFGGSVATAGDADGDGYADILVGAWNYDYVRGKAYLYRGAADAPRPAASWSQSGENDGDRFGDVVAAAGDVNGDGYGDVLIGAITYPGGAAAGRVYLYQGSAAGLSSTPAFSATGEAEGDRFGSAVAAAGDVNGDGYGDVLVGALGYAGSQGKAYLYLGSPAGLSPTPAWTASGESEADRFGHTLTSAGDVDGDGYGDVLAGADGFPNGSWQGKSYLYLGSAAGLSPTPAWTATGGSGDRLGLPVASAGDVNGDGYADVLVGAPGYPEGSFRGRFDLYTGSTAGLSATPAFSATGENDFDFFGAAAAAGDVNGDGYADVVVGASGAYTVTGKAYLYLGTAAGLAPTPCWTARGENEGDWFGSGVQTAGDVNGDGYADVLAGAYGYPKGAQRGRLYLYAGTAAGLSSTPAFTATGKADGDYFAMAVARAGDVDGDGYADILAGAFGSPGGAQRGQVDLHPGNGGGGRVVLARAARGDGSGIPVQPWGLTYGQGRFQARAWATDPMGRGRVQLQVQACPAGAPFTATACLTYTAAAWTDVTTAAGGVALTETISGLAEDTLYHWRARVLYAPQHVVETGITPPPHPAHGPWRRFNGQAVEADLRTPPAAQQWQVYLPVVLRGQ